ncbi:DUF4421 family protein [Tellurirhabdus bombi]|uniref:DUF4421 family protein n=1 Tax=Tellurirhabdus bombi TaxID=2907205 RepID=UPI001F457296|nr:DUF4421 family protein [Tellurirhabdus bombi]
MINPTTPVKILYALLIFFLIQSGGSPSALAQTTINVTPDSARKEVVVMGISLDTLLKLPKPQVDTNYVASYFNFLHLHVVSENRDYFLRLVGNGNRAIYRPNGANAIGLGVSYSWLNVDLTISQPFQQRITERGRTRQLGTDISYNGRKLWFTTNLRLYKGLYLNNPEIIDPDWFDKYTNYPQRGDMRGHLWYSNIAYVFNSQRFANPNLLLNRERQKKSAGSFLVGASFAFTQIRGNSPLFPAITPPLFGDAASLIRVRSVSYSLNAGYVQTFVFRKYFYTTLQLLPGVALRRTSNLDLNQTRQKLPFRSGILGDTRAILGYNDDKFYGSLVYSVIFSSSSLTTSNDLRSYYTYFRLMVGKRFSYKPKGFLRRIPGFQ